VLNGTFLEVYGIQPEQVVGSSMKDDWKNIFPFEP
jgi:hypothetical protein